VAVVSSIIAFGALLLTSSVSAKPATVTMASRRWAFPCAGSVLVEGSGDDVVMVSAEEEPDALLERIGELEKSKTADPDPIDWPDTLRTLSDKAKKLKKRVRDLKKLYVRGTRLLICSMQGFGKLLKRIFRLNYLYYIIS